MDLVRLKHLGDYWIDHPPPHAAIWSIARALGIRPVHTARAGEKITDGAGDILDMLTSSRD
jgi:hypothetical protein